VAVREVGGHDDLIPAQVSGEAVDPVCGMTVSTADAVTREVGGVTFYFCCESCAESFESEPDRFAGAGARPS
jgi:YHS domain-containing protein